ncbi:MAG: hypothetical protein JXB45_08265 [Candidatus Krumholzibacteriota bacterium]|nr:hypothetical protein [Candidatus Krumholzibacteriota bacterium]
MIRFNSSKIIGLIVLAGTFLSLLLPACRQEVDPLDRNRAPETHLTIAPPETTNAKYKVHLYWHGEDQDGVVTRFLWYRSDTLRTLRPDIEPEIDQLDWNPEARREDLLRANITTATDTVFIFEGYDDVTFVGSNRQAFHIVAVDDGGLMDKTPARLQFVAEVEGVPEVEFWYDSLGTWTPFDPSNLDTISMFEDLSVKFFATTVSGSINGYRWVYGGKTYPDDNNDGSPEWYIPVENETVLVTIENSLEGDYLPSGDFYLKVIARDEAGALSRSDVSSGVGVYHTVINHDPDVRILHGDNFFTKQNGDTAIRTVNFDPSHIDTLPYNSRLLLHYLGWDDEEDILQYTDPVRPIQFRYQYSWLGQGLDGSLASYTRWWLPELAEDTNCDSDEDSVTIRVGSYDYTFLVRSYDEQYQYDHTPAEVFFVGNHSPTIDDVTIGFDSIPFTRADEDHPGNMDWRPLDTDTLIIGLKTAYFYRGDTCTAYERVHDYDREKILFRFKFYIKLAGHDHPEDPPGSAIKGWKYNLDAAEDYYFRKENEWIFEPLFLGNYLELEFRLDVPFDPAWNGIGFAPPDPAFVENPPGWMGEQQLIIRASDLAGNATFQDGIRWSTPTFDPRNDPCGNMIALGEVRSIQRSPANYARSDLRSPSFYIKMVY